MLTRNGIVVALLAALSACATGGQGATGEGARKNSDVITTAEIDGGNFRDAYDIVQRLRPTWFTKARSSSAGSLGGMQVSGTSSGSMTGVQASSSVGGLLVYLDANRLGGTETLHDLTPAAIKSLQYMDAATAMAKLTGIGSAVISGAIVASSR